MYGPNEAFWGHEYEKHGSCVDPFYSNQLTYFVTALRVATSTDLYSILAAAGSLYFVLYKDNIILANIFIIYIFYWIKTNLSFP